MKRIFQYLQFILTIQFILEVKSSCSSTSKGTPPSNCNVACGGPPGVQGIPGREGPIGPTGRQGPPGVQGVQGIPGRDSACQPGTKGAAGPKGDQGQPGTKGDQGLRGQPGPKSVTPKVAFSVQFMPGPARQGPYPTNRRITFNTIRTNIGGGFDPRTSIFRCPVAGLYHFSFSMNAAPGHSANVYLMHNNKMVAAGLSANQHVPASATAIVQLKAGDTVWLQLYKGYAVNRFDNSFTGFLFNPM